LRVMCVLSMTLAMVVPGWMPAAVEVTDSPTSRPGVLAARVTAVELMAQVPFTVLLCSVPVRTRGNVRLVPPVGLVAVGVLVGLAEPGFSRSSSRSKLGTYLGQDLERALTGAFLERSSLRRKSPNIV